MSPMTRSRTVRCLGALIGAAALLGALPAPAQAEGRHDRRHERRHDHDRDCEHGRGHGYGRGHDRHAHGRHQVYYAPRYYAPPRWVRADYRGHAPAYTCGRCRTHFGSYDGLYGHVHYHHHVPTWQVPGVLAQVSFGWSFGF